MAKGDMGSDGGLPSGGGQFGGNPRPGGRSLGWNEGGFMPGESGGMPNGMGQPGIFGMQNNPMMKRFLGGMGQIGQLGNNNPYASTRQGMPQPAVMPRQPQGGFNFPPMY